MFYKYNKHLYLTIVFFNKVLPHGGCSTATPGCSKVCVDTLKKGGNAVDGAIAAMFCIGVVNPHHSGIGG